jgi:putative sugar O-methyltransferase
MITEAHLSLAREPARSSVGRQATVAIVMSNYNHGRYLGESLGGIRAQTRPADEIILIDDGSTDRSVKLLERFASANSNVVVLRNAERLGVNASISRAIPLVRSDYLVWTAADDRLLATFLERSMAALERHPEAGLCFSETTQLLGDSRMIKRFATDPALKRIFDLSELPEYLSPEALVTRMKRTYLPIAANTVVVRRDALLELNGFRAELEWYSDSFAYTVVALRHGACVVAETLGVIRTTPGSYSNAMYDPKRQFVVLRRMLDLLATPHYRDIRRLFRAAPSNFSPGLNTMLRAQFSNARDWDLLVAYLLWRFREYRTVRKRGLLSALARLAYRSPLFRRARFVDKQLQDERTARAADLARLEREKAGLELANAELEEELSRTRGELEARAGRPSQSHEHADSNGHAAIRSSGYKDELASITAMFEQLKSAPEIYAPSRFWGHFSDLNLRQLVDGGFENFKLTANQNYHNFTPTSLFDSKVRRLIRLWRTNPTLKPLLVSWQRAYTRMSPDGPLRSQREILGFSEQRMQAYGLFVALLWGYCRTVDKYKVLDRVREPELGNPIRICYGSRLISQDLATSAREYNSVMAAVSPTQSEGERLVVAELGAGYGRLAYVFSEMTDSRYVIFDIPPALGVAHWYLSTLFPGKRVFRFRRFNRFSDIRDELDQSDIAFFTPDQLALFPDRYFDLFLSISSLHEMRFEQIDHYLAEMARLSSRFVYLKQYYGYVNPIDGLFIERGAYSLPADWEIVFQKPEDVYVDFFELMYRRVV